MKSSKLGIVYGFLVWLIPFVVAVFIFPLKKSGSPLFESIMPVVISLCVVMFLNLYFKKVEAHFLKEGFVLGLVWFAVSIAIDLSMFMWGPMKMTFADYMMDIGLTYLMIPIITVGFGLFVEKKVLQGK